MYTRGKVVSGAKLTTEVGGRDRSSFFYRPNVPSGELPNDTALLHFAATAPASGGATILGGQRGAQHVDKGGSVRLPKIKSAYTSIEDDVAQRYDAKTRDVLIQTDYRDNETQTNPYTPNYYIPDNIPDPEILALKGLTFGDGLPAGMEEMALISRLRRRRHVENNLPQGNDAATVEKRMKLLKELEDEEWKEREEHTAQLQQRRLESMEQTLLEREACRKQANESRLAQLRQTLTGRLRSRLETAESQRMAASRRAVNQKLSSDITSGKKVASVAKAKSEKPDLIELYVKYGRDAGPPHTGADQLLKNKRRTADYDIRPALLAEREGAEEVDNLRGKKIERVREKTFEVPNNEAIKRLATLYQRREAERVVNSLEYAWEVLQKKKQVGEKEPVQHILDLYRATPKLQRPDTPVLELAGDTEEEQEEACILLQRLLRGRAVQNDFFEGKERCHGLIEELQAASNAKYAERNFTEIKEQEEMAQKQEAMVSAVLDCAQGDIISDTLGYLFQELFRQQDIRRLAALRDEAEDVRKEREALEIARREEERAQRDREEVQYAAFSRSTDGTIACFLRDIYTSAVENTAIEEAVKEERRRQEALPAPCDPEDRLGKENLICDILDNFVVPAVVDLIDLRPLTLCKIAPAAATLEVMDSHLEEQKVLDSKPVTPPLVEEQPTPSAGTT